MFCEMKTVETAVAKLELALFTVTKLTIGSKMMDPHTYTNDYTHMHIVTHMERIVRPYRA